MKFEKKYLPFLNLSRYITPGESLRLSLSETIIIMNQLASNIGKHYMGKTEHSSMINTFLIYLMCSLFMD